MHPNPYSPPRVSARVTTRLSRFWTRQILYSSLFFGVWFFVGGALSMGGGQIEGAIDGLGLMVGMAYVAFACLGSLATLLR